MVTPVWPNLTAQPLIMGAKLKRVSLKPVDGAWSLDLQLLLDAVTPATRLLVVNAPNNPTGWTLTRAEQQAILEHCRKTGTWILADEVYERLYYEKTPNACAPSFLDVASPDDRLMVAHSFSKSFLMTGWRLGWLVMPATMTHHVGKLVEFNTSCASVFTQRAALAAMQRTDEVTPRVVAHLKTCRDTLLPLLAGACRGSTSGRPKAGCTRSSSSTVSTTRSLSPNDWWLRLGSGWRPATRLRRKLRAGCAGASRRRTWLGWSRAWSGCGGGWHATEGSGNRERTPVRKGREGIAKDAKGNRLM